MINCTTLSGGDPNGSIPSPWKRPDGTVDGSEIPNNHLGCMKPCKWDKLPFPQLVQDFFHQQYAWVRTILLAALLKVSSEAYPQKETSWLFFYVKNHILQINQTLPFRLVIFHQSHQKKAQNPPPSAELPPIQNSILAVVVDGRHLEAIGGKIYKFFLFILIIISTAFSPDF